MSSLVKTISRVLVLLIAVTLSDSVWSQEWEGHVYDRTTRQPIAGAHVFLVQSSIGSITDSTGQFSLSKPTNDKYEVGITHINYEPQFFTITAQHPLNHIIYLSKNTYTLSEIQVTAKSPKRHKRWIKQFTQALLGTSRFARTCVIENTEALRFESLEGGRFSAKSLQPILISNHALGYQLEVTIVQFEADALNTQFSVKPFFRQILSSDTTQINLWNKNRIRAYRGSLRHFLESLSYDQLSENDFLVFEGEIDNEQEIQLKQRIPNRKLIVHQANNRFLNMQTGWVIQHPASSESGTQVRSFLQPLRTIIPFNSPIEVLQANHLSERGYWSRLGIADWLPSDWQYPSHPSTSASTTANGFVLDRLIVNPKRVIKGGPSPNDIPVINTPKFQSSDQISWNDDDMVILVKNKNSHRAYPYKQLWFHQLVNDQINGQSIIVHLSPLTYQATVYQVPDQSSWLVSGLVYQHEALLYEAKSNSLVLPISGQYINAEKADKKLESIPFEILSWAGCKEKYPAVMCWSGEEKKRVYEKNPYDRYHRSDNLWFPIPHTQSARSKEIVVGIQINGHSTAIPLKKLKRMGSKKIQVNGQDIDIQFDRKSQSVLIQNIQQKAIVYQIMYYFAWQILHPNTNYETL